MTGGGQRGLEERWTERRTGAIPRTDLTKRSPGRAAFYRPSAADPEPQLYRKRHRRPVSGEERRGKPRRAPEERGLGASEREPVPYPSRKPY